MEEFKAFLQTFRTRTFSKGEIILIQGEVPECAYAVRAGIVKTYNVTQAGEERPIGFGVAPEIFPISWLFKKANHVQFYYEAFVDTSVYCIPADRLMEFIAIHPKVQYMLLDRLVAWQMHMQMRMNALEQSKASQKIINTIHFLCLRYGKEVRQNQVRIQLPLTQQDLANFIGLTRETTGIELKKLHQQGVLSYRKQNYLIHTDKLNERLDEDYGSGVVFPQAAAQFAQQYARSANT